MAGNIKFKLTGFCTLLAFTALMFIAARCGDDEPFASQLITFIIPATIEPKDSIVHIGDTLWIEINTSDSLYEHHTQKKYKLTNFNFGQTSIVFRKLIGKQYNLSDQLSASKFFGFVDNNSNIDLLGERFVDIKIHYSSEFDKYNLRIGVIPRNTGIYCLQFLGPSELMYEGIIDLGKSSNGAVIIPVYNNIYFPINDGENNYQMFKNNCLATYSGIEDYPGYYSELKGAFTFRVIE